MSGLKRCYNKMEKIFEAKPETYNSVKLVEEYRKYWRPNRVRTILLAESHVFTSDAETQLKVRKLKGLAGHPRHYSRFVYCLAYGEKSLIEKGGPSKNTGTPQYWKLFFSCLNKIKSSEDFSPILKTRTRNEETRFANKVGLLKKLKDNGIWLVDVSVMALYNQGKKPARTKYQELVKISWDNYTLDVIREAKPKNVIIVGKGVAEIVCQDLKKLLGENCHVINQPNARLSSKARLEEHSKCWEICHS